MQNKLKPCPFCGGEVVDSIDVDDSVSPYNLKFTIKCTNCNGGRTTSLRMIDASFDKIVLAIKQTVDGWNRRADNAE